MRHRLMVVGLVFDLCGQLLSGQSPAQERIKISYSSADSTNVVCFTK